MFLLFVICIIPSYSPFIVPLIIKFKFTVFWHLIQHLHNGRTDVWFIVPGSKCMLVCIRIIFSKMTGSFLWKSYLCKFLTEFKWWVVWSVHNYILDSRSISGLEFQDWYLWTAVQNIVTINWEFLWVLFIGVVLCQIIKYFSMNSGLKR